MKVVVQEWGTQFYIGIEPETVQEAAMLVRMGMLAPTKNVDTQVYKADIQPVKTTVYIPKRQGYGTRVPSIPPKARRAKEAKR